MYFNKGDDFTYRGQRYEIVDLLGEGGQGEVEQERRGDERGGDGYHDFTWGGEY